MKPLHSRVLVFGTIFTLLVSMLGAISSARADDNSNIFIKIRSYTCDSDFDGAKSSLAGLNENCVNPGKGLKLTYSTNDSQPQTVNLDNYGGIDFGQYPVGNAKLLLASPKGYEARVFCSLIPGAPPAETPTVTPDPATPSADGGSVQPTSESGGTSGGNGAEDGSQLVIKVVKGYENTEFKNPVEQKLGVGDQWNCTFYNVVVKDPTASTVTINVLNCPALAEKDKADPKYLDSNCTTRGTDGISFELTDSDQSKFSKIVKDGNAVFTNIYPEGGIKLKETFPAGYNDAIVYCNLKAGTDQPPGYEPYTFEGGYITIKGSKGYNIACRWYNLPAPAATVKITKYACPIGVNPPTDDPGKKSNERPECTPQTGVDFTLTTSGAPGEIKQSTGKDGQIIWDRVAAGDVQIVETLPKGYAYPVVYCTIRRVEDQPTNNGIKVAYGDYAPTITFRIVPGASADCTWYNQEQSPSTPTPPAGDGGGNKPTPVPTYTSTPNPNDPASFTINAFICEPDYDLYDNSATPENDCEPAATGIEFEMENSSGDESSATTDSYGTAAFESLKPGTYTLTEIFPDDVASAFVADCTSNLRSFSDNPFTPLNRLDADGNLGVDLKPGENLSCYLYNVPSHTTAFGATVSITLLECPGQTASPEQCSPASSGTQFTLIPNGDNGEEVTLTTDNSGVASGAVSPGTYEVEQLGHDECFADSTAFDANGDLIVAGEAVDVTLYNCGG